MEKKFYEMLDVTNQSMCISYRECLSKLSLAAMMTNIETDHNLHDNYMDLLAELFKEYLWEDNMSTKSYYEIEKLVYSLGLTLEMIDLTSTIAWSTGEKMRS